MENEDLNKTFNNKCIKFKGKIDWSWGDKKYLNNQVTDGLIKADQKPMQIDFDVIYSGFCYVVKLKHKEDFIFKGSFNVREKKHMINSNLGSVSCSLKHDDEDIILSGEWTGDRETYKWILEGKLEI